jgi:type I restriction enzyme S subunit
VTSIRVSKEKAAALRLRPGDVLLNEGGDRDKLGRGWVWEGQLDDCIHQNHVFRARVRGDEMDPYLLSWAANSIGGPWCERNGRQSVNLASISLTRIRLLPVPVPPREAQPAIRARIESVVEASSRLNVAIRAGEQRSAGLRRALLDAAFSGRLTGRASDLDRVEELVGAGV